MGVVFGLCRRPWLLSAGLAMPNRYTLCLILFPSSTLLPVKNFKYWGGGPHRVSRYPPRFFFNCLVLERVLVSWLYSSPFSWIVMSEASNSYSSVIKFVNNEAQIVLYCRYSRFRSCYATMTKVRWWERILYAARPQPGI